MPASRSRLSHHGHAAFCISSGFLASGFVASQLGQKYTHLLPSKARICPQSRHFAGMPAISVTPPHPAALLLTPFLHGIGRDDRLLYKIGLRRRASRVGAKFEPPA